MHYPVTYLFAFLGYSLILIMERVLFDKHDKKPESKNRLPEIKNVNINVTNDKNLRENLFELSNIPERNPSRKLTTKEVAFQSFQSLGFPTINKGLNFDESSYN
jgi:hypothetical protein